MTSFYTESLSDFGWRELRILKDIIDAWLQSGLPEQFTENGIRPAFNTHRGYVFLVNDECDIAMLNGNRLESFHSLPYSGKEGFLYELLEENEPDDLHKDDASFLLNAADIVQYDLQPNWQQYKQGLKLE